MDGNNMAKNFSSDIDKAMDTATKDENRRINVAISAETYDYIKTMARMSGVTLTDFVQQVLNKSMADNETLYQQAKAFARGLK